MGLEWVDHVRFFFFFFFYYQGVEVSMFRLEGFRISGFKDYRAYDMFEVPVKA